MGKSKVEKSKVGKARKSEKVAKADESKSAKVGVEGSKTPKGKGGGKGGGGKSLKSKKGKAAKSGKDDGLVITPTIGCGCLAPENENPCTYPIPIIGGDPIVDIDGTCVAPATWSDYCCY